MEILRARKDLGEQTGLQGNNLNALMQELQNHVVQLISDPNNGNYKWNEKLKKDTSEIVVTDNSNGVQTKLNDKACAIASYIGLSLIEVHLHNQQAKISTAK